MTSHFEEIDDSGESGATGQLTRHVRKFDRLDGGDLHMAQAYLIAPADLDMTALPDADRARDPSVADALMQAFREDHANASLYRMRGPRITTTEEIDRMLTSPNLQQLRRGIESVAARIGTHEAPLQIVRGCGGRS
jgi:hypothetical protein